MLIRPARTTDLESVLQLLEETGLPAAGVSGHLQRFTLAEAEHLQGVAGLEVHGTVGLVRSVVVDPQVRSRGVAAALLNRLVQNARALDLTDLYLLTTSAETYFPRFGFTILPRSHAPPALLASREFQDACPASAPRIRHPHAPAPEGAPHDPDPPRPHHQHRHRPPHRRPARP